MDKNIETLNVMESSYAHIRKNDSEFEAIEAAKQALQEQAEREKGCEYCMSNKVYGAVSFPATINGKVNIRDMEAVEANYCPVCGKRLE